MIIQDAVNFLIQYLKDSGFEGDIENGTALYDLLIKPMAVLYTIFKTETDKAYGYLSIAKAQEYKALLGAEYDTAIDSILSNWFVTRGSGETTSGVVRVYFTKPLTSIYIDNSTSFTINGIPLVPAQHKLYVVTNFVTFFNTVRNVAEYYLDIPVVSITNTGKAIVPGDVVTGGVNSLFYIRAEVNVTFTAGLDPETSDEFISRTKDVITTRELLSEKSLNTVLLDNFPGIIRMYIAGFGSDEQHRDIVTVNNANIHMGNKVDLYIHTPMYKRTIKTNSELTSLDYAHILSVKDTVTNNPLYYTLTDTSIHTPNTVSANITYLYSSYLASVRNFVSSNRVVCCDTKVLPMQIIVLTINITVTLSDLTIIPADIKKYIADYVNGLTHSANYSVLDMVRYLKSMEPGISDIDFPIDITEFTVSNTIQLYTDDSYITVTIK